MTEISMGTSTAQPAPASAPHRITLAGNPFFIQWVLPTLAFLIIVTLMQVGLRVQVPASTEGQVEGARTDVSTVVDFIENRIQYGEMDTVEAVEDAQRLMPPGLTVSSYDRGREYLVSIEIMLDDGWKQIPYSYGYDSATGEFSEGRLGLFR